METSVLLPAVHELLYMNVTEKLCSVWLSSVSCEQIMKLNTNISDGNRIFFQV
jgi:hypothetical protein